MERARDRFRRDVAEQLRMAASKAGLAAAVTLAGDRALLRFEDVPDGLPRIVAVFSEGGDGAPGLSEQLSVLVESDEEQTTLLCVGWRDDPAWGEEVALHARLAELEGRTDESLPLAHRGLNAPADVRTGRYAKGDVIRELAADLKRAAGNFRHAPEPSRALVAIGPAQAGPARGSDRGGTPAAGEARAAGAPMASDIAAQRANVSELLISSLMQALQRDLAEGESYFAGLGAEAAARARFGRMMQWGMLGTAYGVEAKTNQIAVSSFLGSEGASWLYGLVGPVLIGGLPALAKTRVGKGAAYGLMMGWALAMASITASEKGYLDRAQAYFPKRAEVLAHEQAVGAARVRKEAAERDLKRFDAPAKETSALVVEARKRWQLPEIKRAAERESAVRAKGRGAARQAVVEARMALNGEELRLQEALLGDPSRALAWWTLFAIFGVINLAGPLAISRLLEQWRAEHGEAQRSARDGHKNKAAAALLRGSRSAQKAHAMLLLPALLEGLARDGVAREVIAGLDLGDIAQKAAERFDRGVNAQRVGRRWFAPRGPGGGPG
jgi:hypothetical protein